MGESSAGMKAALVRARLAQSRPANHACSFTCTCPATGCSSPCKRVQQRVIIQHCHGACCIPSSVLLRPKAMALFGAHTTLGKPCNKSMSRAGQPLQQTPVTSQVNTPRRRPGRPGAGAGRAAAGGRSGRGSLRTARPPPPATRSAGPGCCQRSPAAVAAHTAHDRAG